MSQITPIEAHVAAVRRKMIFQRFVRYLAVALLVMGGLAWATVLALRLFSLELPGGALAWLAGGLLVSAGVAWLWAMKTAPTAHTAAVAIDERLGLKEKFSTALVIAGDADPFAQLAVQDALRASGRVDLKRKFPLAWPRTYYGVPVWALLIVLTLWLVPSLRFNQSAEAQANLQQQADDKAEAEAKKIIQQTASALAAVPQEVAEREEFRLAKDQLAQARESLTREPAKARQTAKEAQSKLAEALKNQIERGETYAQAKENAKNFRNMVPPAEADGPVADAHRAMANADFKAAMEELEKAVENFDKMTNEEKQQQADQMQNLAQALQQMAQDPQQQQQMQQQMQQMGMDQQQAKQAQQLMQKAAQGDQQAAQQLQNMAQQAMQQMNNGQGPTQQQQQQMQQMMNQLQQQAGSQAQAQQMQQMAQQMAQAMQQQAQQAQQQQGQGQGQQQAQSQGQGQGQSQGGQSGGSQVAGGSGMQNAAQQMQNTLAQMQAVQQNAQQMQAAQGMAQGGGGQGGQQEGAGQQPGQSPYAEGKWDPNQGNGMGGPGQGRGGEGQVAPAPHAFKDEVSKSHDDEEGRVIASTLIKAEALKGESKAAIQEIVESETKEATDEVDQQRVSRQAQKAVREYFQSMAKDAGATPPPAGEKAAEKPAEKPASGGN